MLHKGGHDKTDKAKCKVHLEIDLCCSIYKNQEDMYPDLFFGVLTQGTSRIKWLRTGLCQNLDVVVKLNIDPP